METEFNLAIPLYHILVETSLELLFLPFLHVPHSNTHTELGLKFIRENAFTKAHGDRDKVANILIVVTDGQSTEPAKTKVRSQTCVLPEPYVL